MGPRGWFAKEVEIIVACLIHGRQLGLDLFAGDAAPLARVAGLDDQHVVFDHVDEAVEEFGAMLVGVELAHELKSSYEAC
jgi:hypothetical protein